MKEFSFSTRIFFGEGALERLRQVQNRRVLVVTDRFMHESGVADTVASYLTDCTVSFFDGVVPDPPIEVVTQGVCALQESRAEVMIAVGGGSAIDAAKAIRSVAGSVPGMDTQVMECYAVPTTSGTGSEVTEYAVISDAALGVKYPLGSRALRPPNAILAPELVVSVPPAITADTGMDVLTHAMEAYVSTGANDFSDAMCEKAISLVFRFLPVAYKNGADLLAREKLHNASCMAGLAFNSTGLGINHGIAHAVGAKFHIPHGRINAMLLPIVLRFNAENARIVGKDYCLAAKKYQRLAKVLDLPAPTVALGNNNLVREVEKLMGILKMPANLKAYGLDLKAFEAEREAIVAAALADVTTATNPRAVTEEDVGRLLTSLKGSAF